MAACLGFRNQRLVLKKPQYRDWHSMDYGANQQSSTEEEEELSKDALPANITVSPASQ
jgi:hypothetical protein